MANAVLDLTPLSMEDILPVLVDVNRAQEEPGNAGQAVADRRPDNHDDNPPVSSTPSVGKITLEM